MFFFFNYTAPTEISSLPLHDALPIYRRTQRVFMVPHLITAHHRAARMASTSTDRKSTRLNSSHQIISYAVFCLKKKARSARECADTEREPPRTSPQPWRRRPTRETWL